jgi:hypothetical protein
VTDYAPLKGAPRSITLTAGAPIKAGQCVRISGPWFVAPTHTPDQQNSPQEFIGVAGDDAEIGQTLTILCGSGVIHSVECQGDIDATTLVQAGGGGNVVEWTGADTDAITPAGVAVSSAADAELLAWYAYR